MADILEQPEGQNLQQPNMGVILQSLNNLAVEAALIPNVPAFNNGDQIMATLRNLEQRLDAIGRLIETVSRRDTNNSIARVINSSASLGNTPLEPFYGRDGLLIPAFPATPEEINNLSSARVNSLLEALGLEDGGLILVRRNRLKKCIGLRCLG